MLWASCVNTHENTLKVGTSHLSGPLAWTLPFQHPGCRYKGHVV